MKRFAALLLFVLLAITPLSASMAAGGHPDSISIWDVELNATDQYYKNGTAGGAGSIVTVHDDWNAHYDEANGVLTLRNLNVKGSNIEHIGDICGIYGDCSSTDELTVILEGSSSVSTADSYSFNLCAVKISCNLKILGSGTLTLHAGKAAPVATSTSSYGLIAHSLTQTNGTVKANGGEATAYSSYGVYINEQITVSGGSLTGVGGRSGAGTYPESVGVFANSGITVSGGSLTGVGDWANNSAKSRGMFCVGSFIVTSGRLVGEAITGGNALNKQPTSLPTAYNWRTSSSDDYAQFPPQGFTREDAQSYVDIHTNLTTAGIPKTADSATPMLWLGLALMAGAGLAVSAIVRRRRQNG